MKTYQIFIISCTLITATITTSAQSSRVITDEVKDSIIARYNRNDLTGIYLLADTAFSNNITEQQLTGFLRGNRNSGNVLKSSFQSEVNGKYTYLLECESRDIKMNLQATSDRKFEGFGLSNVSQVFLDAPKNIKTDNPLKTQFDLSVDTLVREYFRNPHAEALSIGIIRNGKRYIFNYGEVENGTGNLPVAKTLYEIGSITKTFTTTLLAQAVLENKVALNDDIRQYLSGDYTNLSFNGKPITLQDLANHTSRLPGLPDNIGDQAGFNPLNPEKYYDSAMYYAALHKVKIDTLPGYKYSYSNWGISILGSILEGVYHKSYAYLLKKYITGPFKMKNTYYELTASVRKDMALPYSENGQQMPFQDEDMFGPAGNIHATLNDMVNYLYEQIIEIRPVVKLTHQPTVGNVGLGWGVKSNGTYRDIQHNGSTIGSTSHLSAFPELNSGCIILTNSKTNLGKLIIGIQQIARRKYF